MNTHGTQTNTTSEEPGAIQNRLAQADLTLKSSQKSSSNALSHVGWSAKRKWRRGQELLVMEKNWMKMNE
jgi:hypothetical protein